MPQDDVEHDDLVHGHTPEPQPQQQETLVQTIAGVLRPKAHVHCKTCDLQLERQERRLAGRHCCAMVAVVFISLFFCGMVLGIVIVNNVARLKKDHA